MTLFVCICIILLCVAGIRVLPLWERYLDERFERCDESLIDICAGGMGIGYDDLIAEMNFTDEEPVNQRPHGTEGSL